MSQKSSGVIKSWQDDKGYGFIETSQNQSVFFHISEFESTHRPKIGEPVVFNTGKDKKDRVQALQVQSRAKQEQLLNTKTSHSHNRSRRQRQQEAFEDTQKKRAFIGIGFYVVLAVIATMGKISWIFVGWYVLIGVVTYFVYAKDKRAAKNGSWRTPESQLHFLSVIGGWVGAMIAQTYLRHKSKKSEFKVVYYLTVIINLFALIYILSDGSITLS